MFIPQTRERIRDALIGRARRDTRVTAAATIGSVSTRSEDRWSDIDLVLGLGDTTKMSEIMTDWTDEMYLTYGALHHFDVWRGESCVRVFLLADTLQVDIAFRPPPTFRATTPSFRLIFGEVNNQPFIQSANHTELIGFGWVSALHVRSSLGRGRLWQAEWNLSNLRNQVLALACSRYDLPTYDGRGTDDLPRDLAQNLNEMLPRSLAGSELRRAFSSSCVMLVEEIFLIDEDLYERLCRPLLSLAR